MHQRKAIRDRVVQILTGLATTGSNVFASRLYPVDAASLPALLIYTLSEASEFDTVGSSRRLLRQLDLNIEGLAQVNDTLDDTLDAIAKEVEIALATDPALGGTARDSMLRSSVVAVRKDGEKESGSIVMTYTVTYRTVATNPEQIA